MDRVGRTYLIAAVALAAACDRPEPLPETPRIEVSTATLSFTAPGAGYDPAPGSVTVTSVGGPLGVTGVSAVYAKGSGWLSLEIEDPRTSPAVVTARPHVAGLASGTYEATVFVSATGVVNSPYPVQVRLVVPPPRIVASASNVWLGVSGAEPPPAYEIGVANAGGGVLERPTVNVRYLNGDGWLSVSVAGVPDAWSVIVQPVLSGIHAFAYHSADLELRSPGAPGGQNVLVSMSVVPSGLKPSPELVVFGFEPGGAVPAPKTIPVALATFPGASVTPPTVQILKASPGTEDPRCEGWLEASLGGDVPSYTLTLTPVASVVELVPSPGCVAVVLLTGENPVLWETLNVELWVESPLVRPLLQVSDRVVEFAALAGGGDPPPQTVGLFDALGGALAAPVVTSASQWLTGTISGAAPPYTLSIQPHVAGLRAGSWSGFVTACAATGSCYSVSVSMNVADWADAGTWWLPHLGHTATALPGGKALLVGAGVPTGDPPDAVLDAPGGFEVYDPGALPVPRGEGRINVARFGHTATGLPDGRVVVAGGIVPCCTGVPCSCNEAVGTWEIYEPASGTWPAAPALRTPRFGHTATLLADGRVLLAGGDTGSELAPVALATAEILDPTTGTTQPAGAMSSPRAGASAVRLASGKVLVAGGRDATGYAVATADLYDPALGTWSATGAMTEARAEAALVLLGDGEVLAAGGDGGGGPIRRPLASAERYDPASGTWSATGSMAEARIAPAVRLPDGRVLMVGGETNGRAFVGAVERYDPALRFWVRAGSLKHARRGHAATLLSDGRVLVTGGGGYLADQTLQEVEIGTGMAPWP